MPTPTYDPRARNYHVVRDIGPQDLQIVFLATAGSGSDEFPKREVLKGELVGSDPFTDTAVIRIMSPTKRLVPMHPLPIGESAALEVGLNFKAACASNTAQPLLNASDSWSCRTERVCHWKSFWSRP